MIANMGIQDVIVLTAVAACVAYTARRVWRTFSGTSGCGCGQSGCSKTTKTEKNAPPGDDPLSLPVIRDRAR